MFGAPFGGTFFGEIWRLLTGVPPPVRLPDNIIVAAVDVDEVARRVTASEAIRTMTGPLLEHIIHVSTTTQSIALVGIQRTVTFDG
jgi:hypothetical protein